MAGSLAPVMYWAECTTLCTALRSDAKQLPYQVVMQPVKMLSMLQRDNFLMFDVVDVSHDQPFKDYHGYRSEC